MTAGLCAAPVGYLVDRLGVRRIVIPAVVLFGCAFASLAALTPRLWHLYAVFALIGMAAIGTSPMAYARVVSSWFTRRRGMAIAVTISGVSIGGLMHPPAAQALIRSVGWRGACLTLGAWCSRSRCRSFSDSSGNDTASDRPSPIRIEERSEPPFAKNCDRESSGF